MKLTKEWIRDTPHNEAIGREFRDGSGNLEFRSAGSDSVLVAYYRTFSVGRASRVVYSTEKILLRLSAGKATGPVAEQQWLEAGLAIGARGPALSAPPTEVRKHKTVRFRSFEFASTENLDEPRFAVSRGGDWIAVLSSKGTYPEFEIDLRTPHGSMYLDLYRVASAEKAIQVQLHFCLLYSLDIFPHAVWISDRHFVFPINEQKTKLMVCDLSPLMADSETVWDQPSKVSEIIGFREEPQLADVTGRVAWVAVLVGVRVPQAGQYMLTAMGEDEHGTSVIHSVKGQLPAGTSQMVFAVGSNREADGLVRIRDIELEKIDGEERSPVARRDFLGIIGPYKFTDSHQTFRKIEMSILNSRMSKLAVKIPTIVPPPPMEKSLPGRIEMLTKIPQDGSKLDTLRFRVGVPRVPGQCTWFATLAANGTFLTQGWASVNSLMPPEEILVDIETKSIFTSALDGELSLSHVHVACHSGESAWIHFFDQFPGYVIPGIRLSMLQHSTPPAAKFTGENRVEFLDTNHDGKYEAIKVTLGFKSDRKCKIIQTQAGEAFYDPHDDSRGLTFYLAFPHVYTSGEHLLKGFDVYCEASDGYFRPAEYDRNYQLPLGTFSSNQFQDPFRLSFESEQPEIDHGAIIYTVNCAPSWTLDLPLEFTAMGFPAATESSFDPPDGACTKHATTLRFKPNTDAPPSQYHISVTGTVVQSRIADFVNTTWIKPGVPAIVGVLPNSGSGERGMFRVKADDPSTGIAKLELLFNTSDAVSHACHIVIANLGVELTDDDGRTVLKSKDQDSPAVENSQCVIEERYNGEAIPVRFKLAFNGPKTIYARAWNGAGATSGWVKVGSWTVSQNEPPVAIAVSPYLAATDHQTLFMTVADPNGAGDIQKIEALIAFAPSDEHACRITVDRAAGTVSVAGGNTVPLGSAGAASNSLCSVGHIQVIEEHGRMLRLSADVRFTPAFRGRRNIFLKAVDRSNIESDWLWGASWEVR